MFADRASVLIDLDQLLEHINQFDMFKKYGADLQKGRFSSPLRKDKNPSCDSFIIDNKVIMKDFTTGESFDLIKLVQRKYNLSFQQALYKIYDDSGMHINFNNSSHKTRLSSRKTVIKVNSYPLDNNNAEFFKKYGISLSTLQKYNVYRLFCYWINDNVYYPGKNSFVYKFSQRELKIYLPGRKEGKSYFLTNCSGDIMEGYNQLPPSGELLIITKSLKDVMVLYEMNYNAVAPLSETSVINKSLMADLQIRFNKIIVLFDRDMGGLIGARRLLHDYNLPFIFIKDQYAKDISDYCLYYSVLQTKKYINHAIYNRI